MCSPDEGPRRSETSQFFIKSLELVSRAYFLLFIYIYNIAVLIIICRFESTLLLIYAKPTRVLHILTTTLIQNDI